MAEITALMVKELRDRTDVGMSKCKEALQEAGGDMEQAIVNLRKSGMASAVKKEGRETTPRIHPAPACPVAGAEEATAHHFHRRRFYYCCSCGNCAAGVVHRLLSPDA